MAAVCVTKRDVLQVYCIVFYAIAIKIIMGNYSWSKPFKVNGEVADCCLRIILLVFELHLGSKVVILGKIL